MFAYMFNVWFEIIASKCYIAVKVKLGTYLISDSFEMIIFNFEA